MKFYRCDECGKEMHNVEVSVEYGCTVDSIKKRKKVHFCTAACFLAWTKKRM